MYNRLTPAEQIHIDKEVDEMTKADMMLKLETVAGIGTITTLNGKPRYNFYPDTFNESGLAIAMRTLYPLMDSGDIETITFVENSETLRRLENER